MARESSKDPELEIKARLKGSKEVKEWTKNWKENKNMKAKSSEGAGGALYFVGFVGSLVYWWQAAIGFGAFVTAILKSLVWPAYVVYKLLEQFYGVVS